MLHGVHAFGNHGFDAGKGRAGFEDFPLAKQQSEFVDPFTNPAFAESSESEYESRGALSLEAEARQRRNFQSEADRTLRHFAVVQMGLQPCHGLHAGLGALDPQTIAQAPVTVVQQDLLALPVERAHPAYMTRKMPFIDEAREQAVLECAAMG